MSERALLARWRNALRDSELDSTAKAVGFVISTYWDKRGHSAFPSKRTIADGASLRSTRAADVAVLRLEQAGFLAVSRTRGGNTHTNTYIATLPTPHGDAGITPHDGAGLNGANPASDDTQPRTELASTPHPGAGESGKAKAELNALRASRADGKNTRADARDYSGYNNSA